MRWEAAPMIAAACRMEALKAELVDSGEWDEDEGLGDRVTELFCIGFGMAHRDMAEALAAACAPLHVPAAAS